MQHKIATFLVLKYGKLQMISAKMREEGQFFVYSRYMMHQDFSGFQRNVTEPHHEQEAQPAAGSPTKRRRVHTGLTPTPQKASCEALTHLALREMGKPATSAPSERVFSSAGFVMQARRSGMSSSTLDKVLFMEYYLANKVKLRIVEVDLFLSDEETMEPLYIEESSQETTASSPLKLHPSGLMYEELSCDPEAAASPSINNEGAANEGAGNEDTANLKDAASEAPATEAPGEEAAAAEEGCKPTPHPLSLPDLLEEGACDGFETPNGRRKRVAHKPVEPPGSIPNVASSVTKDGVKPAKVSVFDRLEKRPAAAQQRHKGEAQQEDAVSCDKVEGHFLLKYLDLLCDKSSHLYPGGIHK
ncbi:hypothetical protein FOCC_FOCC004052 [Frankliniella occidentalis]|nr:hypothetical protein FOCC_FOCC004052 [Frankliniella occidentalis]